MNRWIVYLKDKWDIKSNFQLFLIFVVFGLTGSFSLKLAKPILYYFGFNREIFNDFLMGDIFYWSLRLIIIFPIYQFVLIGVAFVFGELRYFKKFFIKFINYFKIY